MAGKGPGWLGVGWVIQVQSRISLPINDKAHRIPRAVSTFSVDGVLCIFVIPIARFTEMSLASRMISEICTEVVGLIFGFLSYFVRGAKLKARMLGISVQVYHSFGCRFEQ